MDDVKFAIVGNVVKNVVITAGVCRMAEHFNDPKLLSWLLIMPFTDMFVTTKNNSRKKEEPKE